MDQHTWDRIADALNDADFPASKDEIVQRAQRHAADDETMRLLRALPLDPAVDEGRMAAERAEQARSPHIGVAEYLRDR